MLYTDMSIRYQEPYGDFLLSPCPFCGCRKPLYEEYKTPVGNRWRVVCPDCVATLDPGYAQQKITVQEMWNRRA